MDGVCVVHVLRQTLTRRLPALTPVLLHYSPRLNGDGSHPLMRQPRHEEADEDDDDDRDVAVTRWMGLSSITSPVHSSSRDLDSCIRHNNTVYFHTARQAMIQLDSE